MIKQIKQEVRFAEDDTILIHVTVTGRCNARCTGCINSTITTANLNQPRDTIITFQEAEPLRDSTMVLNLAERFPDRRVVVCFYGGEPLLAPEKIEEIRSRLNSSPIKDRLRYMIYTNGELIENTLQLFPALISETWLTSVSIDGNAAQHNRVRPGTDLANIVRNLKVLHSNYEGHILMWTTLREDQSLKSCFEEFIGLHDKDLINHWFWHWVETKDPFQDLSSYMKVYEQDLRQVLDEYILRLDKGIIIPIAHINELVIYLLTGNKRGHTCCAVELGRNFDLVDGTVRMCVDFPQESGLGDINNKEEVFDSRSLADLIRYKPVLGCHRCCAHFYCGGRCPVQALYGGMKRTRQYCKLTRLHISVVREYIERIRGALEKHRIKLQYLYEASAFITRYTDVIP